MTQKWGVPDTQGALPSQTGSTTPMSALLCGLSSMGRGSVGEQGNRPSLCPPPRDLVAWGMLEGLRTMKLYAEVSLHMHTVLTMGEGSGLLLRTDL